MNPLVAKVISEGRHDITAIDAAEHKTLMDKLHQRFVDERVEGWVNPETGEQLPPVTREEAEQRWQKVRALFAKTLLRPDTDSGGTVMGKITKPPGGFSKPPEKDDDDDDDGDDDGDNPTGRPLAPTGGNLVPI